MGRAQTSSLIRFRGDPVPTTITLTPTLTLSVGDRRMPQQRVEDVWSSIAQHTRATDRPATIAVMDGSETLRVWELRPDGSKALLDHESLEAPDFRLLLSPWTMAVPLDNGPDHREVSTLAVAPVSYTHLTLPTKA